MKWRTRGLLFDMDGVLISSLGSVERGWTKWARMRGVDPDLAVRTAHGCRAIETIRKLRPDLDDEAELKVIEDIEVDDNEGLTILVGVAPILNALPTNLWTVVTSATERLARIRMAHGGISVPTRMVTAEMVEHGKPHPEPYLRGAELLGRKPEECVVIEDSASGADAGHAAGCKVLATTFSHSMESLAAADWIIGSLKDLRVTLLSADEGLELEFEPLPRP
jgi:mannitol-1-/sugar-/sorbitol-6-phosphatase